MIWIVKKFYRQLNSISKQRIAQAKIKAAEKRAVEIAARQADHQDVFAATPSRTPFSTSSFIENSTPPTSNSAPQPGIPFLRSPATGTERIQRANSLEALSKKIDNAGNFRLQELITKMILRCPGAKEVAESFFVLDGVENDVQSNNSELDGREEDCVGSHGHERESASHVVSAQLCTPSYSSKSLETELPTNSQTIPTNDINFQPNYARSIQGGSKALSSSTRFTEEVVDIPTNNPTVANISGSEISKALDNFLNVELKSRETSSHDNPGNAAPQIAIPEVNDYDVASTSHILQSPPNNLSMDFSFEAFNNLVDSVRKNVERMQRASKTSMVSKFFTSSVVREDSGDLGSPIPIDANGQELGRGSGLRDDINPIVQATMDRPVSSSSEEDDYVNTRNITSSHYNCEGCRKPIVLPEGFVVSLENPAPTTCLHCRTLKASRTIRRRFGARDRSDINTGVPAKRKDGQSSPGEGRHDVTESSHTPAQVSGIVPGRLEPPTDSLSEPSSELGLASSLEHLQQSTTLEQVDENLNETPASTDRHRGNEKDEHLEDTIVVESPACHISANSDLSSSQILTDGKSLPRKRKAEKIKDEAFYPFPIGPKRRRGRPLKNLGEVIPDSLPTSSPQPSTPTTNSSSQDTPTSKKRGRPLRTGERQSARKAREITQILLKEESDCMPDVTSECESQIQPLTLRHRKKKSKIRGYQATASCGTFVPNTKVEQDSDPEYVPPQESKIRHEKGSINIATSNSILGSSSLENTVPAGTGTEELGPGVIDGRDSRSPRAPNLTFTVEEQLRQSLEEQENRMENNSISQKITSDQS
ncbi:hypothetical protein DID88_001023 [Monilinia fructigena]|uniref:Uncharacterized protein n=1 Tax=Monilinia fructigena TaxID=38457 RepID=A0A395IYW9_9HELO|nr:hypothetical protein DID88_001023 [Monilinia fructigena]